jgi:hypothetical protein
MMSGQARLASYYAVELDEIDQWIEDLRTSERS